MQPSKNEHAFYIIISVIVKHVQLELLLIVLFVCLGGDLLRFSVAERQKKLLGCGLLRAVGVSTQAHTMVSHIYFG